MREFSNYISKEESSKFAPHKPYAHNLLFVCENIVEAHRSHLDKILGPNSDKAPVLAMLMQIMHEKRERQKRNR